VPEKKAIIIGAGPAGLTAAYELLKRTDIKPVVFEMTKDIGGISKTVKYKGNRIDIGGHRFYSKSDRVMDWWINIIPLQGSPSRDDITLEREIPLSKDPGAPDPEKEDRVILFRRRISRIYFLRRFFDYPVTLSYNTITKMGILRTFKIGLSYLLSKAFPIKKERSLEDFFINRFGRELYLTFFKDYTEKLWGIQCSEIKPEWGAQRVKGLSISKAIVHALKKIFKSDLSIRQKKTETSLIGQFMYPKFGPGQMWETVADFVSSNGGEVHLNHEAVGVEYENERIVHIIIENQETSERFKVDGDYFFSTMPVKDWIKAMGENVPENAQEVAEELLYRDFITVGLLLKKLKIKNRSKFKTVNNIIPDNWIYIQERDVKLGRLQVFNNWSPYLVKDPDTAWIGLEYFCNEGDDLWNMEDEEFAQFAIGELAQIDIIEKEDVLDHVVIRMPKAYPGYFGTYDQFHIIREFTDKFENLFLIGRNGMHRYNNQDHSMLSAMTAVDNIIDGVKTKENIWAVNTEEEYHEEKRPNKNGD